MDFPAASLGSSLPEGARRSSARHDARNARLASALGPSCSGMSVAATAGAAVAARPRFMRMHGATLCRYHASTSVCWGC